MGWEHSLHLLLLYIIVILLTGFSLVPIFILSIIVIIVLLNTTYLSLAL